MPICGFRQQQPVGYRTGSCISLFAVWLADSPNVDANLLRASLRRSEEPHGLSIYLGCCERKDRGSRLGSADQNPGADLIGHGLHVDRPAGPVGNLHSVGAVTMQRRIRAGRR
jgi:hypothetical protein